MGNINSLFYSPDLPRILGHRGVPEEYQENTLPGFKRAVELGLDGVELDVFLTKDAQLVVFHDANTQRLTGFNGQITDMSWAQLRELDILQSIDVGDRVIDYSRPQKIALLEDVLQELKGKLLINIEIKTEGSRFSQKHLAEELAQLIQHMDLIASVCVTSLSFWPLIWLKRANPDIECGLTFAGASPQATDFVSRIKQSAFFSRLIDSRFTSQSIQMFDEDSIERIHRQKMTVGVWTIFPHDSRWFGEWFNTENELNCIRRLTQQGIDYFITDDPVRLKAVISSPESA